MTSTPVIRTATLADVGIIARHRAGMFLDMGSVTQDGVPRLIADTETYLRDAIPRAEYFGWLIDDPDALDRPVASAGVQLRRVLPAPRRLPDGSSAVARGRQGIVLNVYTEPPFRRRGLARRLMGEILRWARRERLDSLVLHTSADGQHLYESMGFVATNEMRYTGDLEGEGA